MLLFSSDQTPFSKNPLIQSGRYNNCKAAVEMINAAGGDAAFLDLPAMGINGNTHLLMQDDNSDDIAEMVTDWIAEKF